ncbi:efflux RND transporter periplasmic adaptor subunit [Rhizosphaericola mali]|uniref:Efflux RND transporter periplasmic adaptor subunit n=1 Tax=Rhizosphaericola mali TaxID=2545455 RepID=A0A5P2G0C1_9BACT|nr:efflux RND transporter periplasmic adaptor subunit [Rhizosphaericola mali]QES89244.1 efflux RND transporter periplasmic adaptor subunit [Rhizosphaericola mali]
MSNISRCIYSFIASSVLLFSACKSKEDKTPTLAQTPINVNVMTIGNSFSSDSSGTQYSSTVDANKTINLSFQVSGTVLRIPVEVGQYVQKGQFLAEVDPTAYRSQYEAQMAQVRLAKENYDRVLTVFNKGSIAEIKMLNAKSEYEQAKNSANATYQNIVHTKLFAPQSGYIGDKQIEVGATAGPGVPIVSLFDLGKVSIHVPVPEAEVNNYKNGDKATVTIGALQNKTFDGVVSKIAVVSSQSAPVYTVQVDVVNSSKELKPGMSCNVTFHTIKRNASASNTKVTIPQEALQIDESGKDFVYVTNSDQKNAVRKYVTIGELTSNGITILSGLNDGDNVIISGFHKITDSSKINVVH